MMRRFYISLLFFLLFSAPGFIARSQSIREIESEASRMIGEGRYDEAIGFLHGYADMDKDYYPFELSLFEAYNRKALDLKERSLYAAADTVYNSALSDTLLTPYTNAVMELNYAELLLRRGMYNLTDKRLNKLSDFVFAYGDKYLQCDWCLRKAETLSYLRQYDAAKSILGDLEEEVSGEKSAEIHATLGFILLEDGNADDEALSHLQTAYGSIPSGIQSYALLSNIALLKAKMGQIGSALEDIESCLSWWMTRPDYKQSPDYNKCLRKKAEILFMSGRRLESRKCFEAYFKNEKAILAEQFPTLNAQQRLDYWKNRNPLLSEMYVFENECPDLLFDLTLFRRAISMMGQKSKADMKRLLSTDMAAVSGALGKDEVAVEFIRYSRSFQPYGDTTARYGAIVLPSGQSRQKVQFIPLWTEQEINNYLLPGGSTLMDAIISRDKVDKNIIYSDSALGDFIWLPLQPYVKGASRIYFVPDGILNLLAIEYLPAGHMQSVEAVRMTSTVNILNKQTDFESLNLLAAGGLDFYSSVGGSQNGEKDFDAYDYFVAELNRPPYFKRLPGTLEELATIDSLGIKHRIKTKLFEKTVKDSLHVYSALHIGTHAYSLKTAVAKFGLTFNEDITEDRSLLASAMALSGANVAKHSRQSQDGLLSAREISFLNLQDMNLVVLSACESANGQVSDEGPVGFVRGFKIAGAKTILATLWPVSDAGTAYFMSFFYNSLSQTGSPYRALRTAQQKMRDLNAPFDEPYYWAPFVLIDSK